ncbi:MAG: uracil-DNA glycosylase [Acidiferrobacterales bacterium]|nr:uracil-DNA glycosylase [Acidiferrobacterales bacterium]
MNPIDEFVLRLSKKRNTSIVSNPYIKPELASNLKVYLNAIDQIPTKPILLIGEALGFKGGKLTGIPFSSGQIFERFEHPFLSQIKSDIILRDVESENTATIVWEYLSARGITPLCWNAFPFHPHPKGQKNKNRAPTAKEVKSGQRYLKQLQIIFESEIIIGVGSKGAHCARAAFPERHIIAVRHPSFGGKSEFIRGMDKVLNEL